MVTAYENILCNYPVYSILKSRFDSTCPGCKQKIFKGDDIIQAGSGSWVHKICPIPKQDNRFEPLEDSITKSDEEELPEIEIKPLSTVKCINCQNQTFFQKRLHTTILDDGGKITTKVYICEKCYYKMEFVEP